jgi:hypothetical protein
MGLQAGYGHRGDNGVGYKYSEGMPQLYGSKGHVRSCTLLLETFQHTLGLMEEWLEEAETDPDLLDCIAKFAHGQGRRTMTKIYTGLGPQFTQMAKEQDAI